MNPLIKQHLQEIDKRLDILQDILKASNDRTEYAENQRKKGLEKQLQHRKQLVTLEHKGELFDAMQNENKDLEEKQQQLKESLKRLLSQIKSLTKDFKL